MATMQLDVTFRNIESSEALKTYAREKVERVTKYVDRPMEAHVVLSTERHMSQADIQIHVAQANLVLRGKTNNNDMYAAIDLAVDKIERQLRRYKDKVKDHKPSHDGMPLKVRLGILASDTGETVGPAESMAEAEATPMSAGATALAVQSAPRVIRNTDILARPMPLEEAIMQMDLMNNQFYIFRSATTEHVNIVYRRDDGNIGLIETAGE